MKRYVPAILAALVLVSAAHKASAENIKIAFVDLRRALNETEEGKAAMAKLKGMKDKLQTKIEGKEKEILAMKDAIEKQQNVLTKDALQKKVEEYYRSVTELQQTYMQFQKELAGKEAELTQGILEKMAKILEQIGRTESYTMIYDRSSGAVVWAPSHLDLTDKLIQQYNANNKAKK
ncbi:MAG: OmpH family outer membrane protein [Deltaproteobacteria bacterium]|nr:OmpH family outer membrane protein [Deltaproteobacteria bacterium]